MGDVYPSADEVIVWLGPHDAAPRLIVPVMEKVQIVYQNFSPKERPKGPFEFGSPLLFSKLGITPITAEEWSALADFFSRRWFHRFCITQEVALSKKLGSICGDSIIPTDTITGFAKWVCNLHWEEELNNIRRNKRDHPVCGNAAFGHASRLIYMMNRGLANSDTRSLFEAQFGAPTKKHLFVAFLPLMLVQNQHRVATDLKDKVFAPLALTKMVTSDEELIQDIPPVDHGETISCVNGDITAYITRILDNLSILSYADGIEKDLELSSWTPDYSATCDRSQISELNFRDFSLQMMEVPSSPFSILLSNLEM